MLSRSSPVFTRPTCSSISFGLVPAASTREGFAISYEIVEFVEPELLIMRSDPMPGHRDGTVVRVQLHDHGPKTRMTLSDGPFPAAGRGHAEAGYEGALDKLAAHLAVTSAP